MPPYRLPPLGHYWSGQVFADRATLQLPLPRYAFVGHYKAALGWVALEDFIETARTKGITAEGFNAFQVIPPAVAADDARQRNEASIIHKDTGRGQFADYLTLNEVYGDWTSSTRHTPLNVDEDY
ncbi:hypothetical protein GIV19_03190 [Pseudomonas syringae]|uniref:hypothetical protein n=1 Tax=Pseudomonas syringae TaxID=317 RepID=UPI001F306F18|nr:hypothetical protein [Pseudomonas syringae]MCF5706291.1 hypothetical protein [Pseudomonas syringae]